MPPSETVHVVLWVSAALVTAWTFVPIAVMVWASLMPLNALMDRGLLQWPSGMSFANYKAILGIASIHAVSSVGSGEQTIIRLRALAASAEARAVARRLRALRREPPMQGYLGFARAPRHEPPGQSV
jgi:ABC-type glycerol-3-phosphate transport system permease component